MGSSTSPAVVLRLDVSAVKAGKRAVIGCEHRRIILYRSPVVGRVVVSEDGLVGIARETDARPKPADGSGRSNCMENFSPD
jgi:hypothetical protein